MLPQPASTTKTPKPDVQPQAMLRRRALLCLLLVVTACCTLNATVLYRGGRQEGKSFPTGCWASWGCLRFCGCQFCSGGVWRAYFLPTEEVWDSIHAHGQGLEGGIWQYNQSKLENATTMLCSKQLACSPHDLSCLSEVLVARG